MLLRLFVRLSLMLESTTTLLAGRVRSAQAQRGQATVEYVALILLVAGVLAAAVAIAGTKNFNLADAVSEQLNKAIRGVSGKSTLK